MLFATYYDHTHLSYILFVYTRRATTKTKKISNKYKYTHFSWRVRFWFTRGAEVSRADDATWRDAHICINCVCWCWWSLCAYPHTSAHIVATHTNNTLIYSRQINSWRILLFITSKSSANVAMAKCFIAALCVGCCCSASRSFWFDLHLMYYMAESQSQ